MAKPVLLLDLDGVVNAIGKRIPTQCWKQHEWRTGSLFGFPLKWAQPVVDWLNKIDENGLAEIRWHTTWQEMALDFGELAGLNRFKIQDCPEWDKFNANGTALAADLIRACQPPWWKYPAAERVAAEEKRPVVWIDDDINDEIPRRTRAALASVHTLCLVSPDLASGLTPKYMRQVDEFLERCNAPQGALSAS